MVRYVGVIQLFFMLSNIYQSVLQNETCVALANE